MLNPIAFLWKQFNGPQITAITQAIFNYFQNLVDENLDYFNDITLDTANSQHLSLLGILQGLSRPLVPIPDAKMFFLTPVYGFIPDPDNPGHYIPEEGYPSERGFSQAVDRSIGGQLDVVPEAKSSGYKYIPDYIYRSILKSNSKSKGSLGGLVVLDDMLYDLFQIENPEADPVYRFEWSNGGDTTPGDVTIDLGSSTDWLHPYEVYAQFNLLGSTVYFPIPRLFAKLSEGSSALDPDGLIHILLQGTESTYGLDNMWAGTGTPSDVVEDGKNPDFDCEPITTSMLQQMWAEDSSWLDDQGPDYFIPLTTAEIGAMW